MGYKLKIIILGLQLIFIQQYLIGEPVKGLSIDHAYLRKLSPLDEGTVHMFLKNESDESISVLKVILDNIVLPPPMLFGLDLGEELLSEFPMLAEIEEDKRIIWYQVIPNPIPPGKVADVRVKLVLSPYRPVNIGVESNDGNKYNAVIQPMDNSLHITYIGFSEGFDKVYIYLENAGKENLEVTRIFLDIQDVTVLSFKAWEVILPEEKKCIVVKLDKPLRQGEYITIKIETKEGIIAESIVRIFSFFPISSESGGSSFILNLDQDNYVIDYTDNTSAFDTYAKNSKTNKMYHILDCPTHAFGSYRRAASKISSRIIMSEDKIPFFPTYMHLCKCIQERGSFLFGELTDIIRTNPIEPSSKTLKKPMSVMTQQLANIMKVGASPHPWHAVIPIVKDYRITDFNNRIPTPEEVRLMVYCTISQGAKGIFYRFEEGSINNPKMKTEVKKINTELCLLRELLRIGEPIPLAKSNDSMVESCTIQASYESIVLILINHDIETKNETNKFIYTPRENFIVTVNIPNGMDIKGIYGVDDALHDIEYTLKDRDIVLPIKRLDLTKQMVLTTISNNYKFSKSKEIFSKGNLEKGGD